MLPAAMRWLVFLVLIGLCIATCMATTGPLDPDVLVLDANGTDPGKELAHRNILNKARHIEIAPGVLAAVAIGAGSLMCLAGYRLFRPALAVCGFLLGALAGAVVVGEIIPTNTAVAIGSVLFGILGVWLVLSVYSVGIFAIGATGGVFVAYTLQPTLAAQYAPENPNTVLAALVLILGMLGGVATVYLERPMLIIATTFIGAHTSVWGIGYFAGGFPDPRDIKALQDQDREGHVIYDIPRVWWAYLGAIIVYFILGMYVQFAYTGRDHDHRKETKKQPDQQAANETKAPDYGAAVVHV